MKLLSDAIKETNKEIIRSLNDSGDMQAFIGIVTLLAFLALTITEAVITGSLTHFLVGVVSFFVYGLINAYIMTIILTMVDKYIAQKYKELEK